MPNLKSAPQPSAPIQLNGWTPPDPQQLQQQQPQQQPVVFVNQMPTPSVPFSAVGPNSARITCPSCRADIKTRIKHKATSNTHCWAVLLCCCLCWPCVCLPYCMDSCQNANHYCPNCNAFIGTYQS
ncbi:lipopolysaccharide-induced tumor necrosis factor-alpha factor homolog isoform X3 [Eupeodes corollae]|uniref:lipopolysaccharide-induced tumor necrosis factor-alpha factor homolog isoform X3 n=1 Tax=Eupeodes corollae TaxID=290404 RepID=UPI00249101E3|nr:lipopolysaccharide-induced tumor necrosis factor-alpha factor homolog isoform X3 [Eupeodes corollae]